MMSSKLQYIPSFLTTALDHFTKIIRDDASRTVGTFPIKEVLESREYAIQKKTLFEAIQSSGCAVKNGVPVLMTNGIKALVTTYARNVLIDACGLLINPQNHDHYIHKVKIEQSRHQLEQCIHKQIENVIGRDIHFNAHVLVSEQNEYATGIVPFMTDTRQSAIALARSMNAAVLVENPETDKKTVIIMCFENFHDLSCFSPESRERVVMASAPETLVSEFPDFVMDYGNRIDHPLWNMADFNQAKDYASEQDAVSVREIRLGVPVRNLNLKPGPDGSGQDAVEFWKAISDLQNR